MANGVQGKMDLTVPSGASSVSLTFCGMLASGIALSVTGEMNRTLMGQCQTRREPGCRTRTDLWYRLNRN